MLITNGIEDMLICSCNRLAISDGENDRVCEHIVNRYFAKGEVGGSDLPGDEITTRQVLTVRLFVTEVAREVTARRSGVPVRRYQYWLLVDANVGHSDHLPVLVIPLSNLYVQSQAVLDNRLYITSCQRRRRCQLGSNVDGHFENHFRTAY